jgi:hypothetical protein
MSDEPISEVVVDAAADDLPKRKTKKDEAPALSKYMVIGGPIAPNGGGRSALIQPGSIVELTTDQAKHYNNLGYLKPYIGD